VRGSRGQVGRVVQVVPIASVVAALGTGCHRHGLRPRRRVFLFDCAGRMIVRRRAAEEHQRSDQPDENFATATRHPDSSRKTKHPQEAPHSSGMKPIVASPMHHATSPPIHKIGDSTRFGHHLQSWLTAISNLPMAVCEPVHTFQLLMEDMATASASYPLNTLRLD
jgi:hypothetical protein